MPTATGTVLAGALLTAGGLLWTGLYDIGVMLLVLGFVGVCVRLGDLVRR